MTHGSAKRKDSKGLTLAQKAKVLRANRGSIQEIANELGVHYSTVSFILDKKLRFSRESLERYLNAIDRKVDDILSGRRKKRGGAA